MNIKNRIVIGIFLCFIGGIACLQLFLKDVHFSEAENRVLVQMPEFTLDNFTSGKFTSDFEKYLSDQFVNKAFWTGLKTSVAKATLKQENNGVYFGKDDYLLEKFEKPGAQLAKNTANISYFGEKEKSVSAYLMLVPTSVEIYPEKLPLFAHVESQKEVLDNIKQTVSDSIKWIDPYESLLQGKKDQIYFHTDHHWTTRGAYIAYRTAAKEIGFKPYELDDFNIETVSKNFYGTHYAKANDYTVEADEIEIFKPKFDVSYQVEIEDGQSTMNSLYEWDYLKRRDQYSMFLNGNHSKVKIASSVENGRKLLLIKDSYAHAMVPFLANHFEEIHMIDLRYYHESIYDYLEKNEIEDVLFLYNVTNFAEDTNLIWLRQ